MTPMNRQINERLDSWDPKQGEFHYNGLAVLHPERNNIIVSAAGPDGLRAAYFVYRRQVEEARFDCKIVPHNEDCKCRICEFPSIEDIIADGFEVVALYRRQIIDEAS